MLVLGSLSRVADEHVFTLRRLDQKDARVFGTVARRFTVGNGEEFLGAVGGVVAELFPEQTLRPGTVRGASTELARRLNPAPLQPWLMTSGVVATSLVGAAAIGAFAFNAALWAAHERYVGSSSVSIDIHVRDQKLDAANATAITALVLGSATVVLGLATGAAALFTDFDGPAAE